jgi:hypothetical protein
MNTPFFLLKINYFSFVALLIFIFVSLNSLFNALSVAFGGSLFTNTFLMPPHDLFGDYFKTTFSFVTNQDIKFDLKNYPVLNKLLHEYLNNNNYKAINPETNLASNLHGMPSSTLFCLVNLWLMNFINPLYLFIINIILILVLNFIVLKVNIRLKYSNIIFIVIAIFLSYPTLFMLVRGHLLSALTNLLLLTFLLSLCSSKNLLAVIALALACNIRPNCAIFAVLFLTCFNYLGWRASALIVIKYLLLSIGIFLVSLFFAHKMYTPYTLTNFLMAVKTYRENYIVGDAGFAYGSSLAGGFKFMFGYNWITEVLALLVPLVMLLITSIGYLKNRIDTSSFIFLVCSIYCLATSVFADYYLGIFIAPIICLYLYKKPFSGFSKVHYVQFGVCILMLVPKNYIYTLGGVSHQVLLNPTLLSLSFFIVLSQLFLTPNTLKIEN